MKKILVTALMATLLFTGIGTTASAESTCQHNLVDVAGMPAIFASTGHGYTHGYSITSTQTGSCNVTVTEKYVYKECTECHIKTYVATGKKWDSHQITEHNGPKP